MTTLLVIADDEGVRTRVEKMPASIVLSCGDLADGTILEVARLAGSSQILAVKGNHDSSGDFPSPIVDLHLSIHTVEGIRFGGFNGSWKYKPRGNYLYEQSEVDALMSIFPAVDVFVSHNSPRHIHDRDDDVHLGFDAFVPYIKRTDPRFFIHGHQHVNCETLVGKTQVIGVYGHRRLELE